MNSQLFSMKKERGGMHFHSRKRSGRGVAGFVLSLFGVLLFVGVCVVSAMAKGEAGILVGILGLLTMALCVGAFCLCLKGLKERDVYTTIPFVGLIISGTLFVVLFCLYVLGIRF